MTRATLRRFREKAKQIDPNIITFGITVGSLTTIAYLTYHYNKLANDVKIVNDAFEYMRKTGYALVYIDGKLEFIASAIE